jgi:predicted AlkP superfamily pyrophosphatase or phosphodiesterase
MGWHFYLFPKAVVNHDQNANGDIAIANAASKYIIEKKPNFLFVHLHDVDSVGHNVGHGTPEYYAAIERTDTHIGTILKSIKEAGIEKNTVVLFTADHGGVNKGHESLNEMQIPWIMRPGSSKKYEPSESIDFHCLYC